MDSCRFAKDGQCEDGGPGTTTRRAYCELGADCSDCGPRTLLEDFKPTRRRVKRHETLNSIGEEWGVRAGALELWNAIGDPTQIVAGQEIIVTHEGYLERMARLDKQYRGKLTANESVLEVARRLARVSALRRLMGKSRWDALLDAGVRKDGLIPPWEEGEDTEWIVEEPADKPQGEDFIYYRAGTDRDSHTAALETPDYMGRGPRQRKPACVTPSRVELAEDPLRHSLPVEAGRAATEQMRWLIARYGGHGVASWWEPADCSPEDTVAVVVPFRNREKFLPSALARLHPLLRKQRLRYRIFVVDQVDTLPFNRAKLLNVGAVLATRALPRDVLTDRRRLLEETCFVMHDIDLIPLSDTTPYRCPQGPHPHHLSVAVDTHGGKCVYSEIFGGVSVLTVNQMVTVNGYSNLYWGWGGEDDDMSQRIRRAAHRKILRPTSCLARGGVCHWEAHCLDQTGLIEGFDSADGEASGVDADTVGHYSMVGGTSDSVDGSKAMDPSHQAQLAIAADRSWQEGMSTLKFTVVETIHHALYTRWKVDLIGNKGFTLPRSQTMGR